MLSERKSRLALTLNQSWKRASGERKARGRRERPKAWPPAPAREPGRGCKGPVLEGNEKCHSSGTRTVRQRDSLRADPEKIGVVGTEGQTGHHRVPCSPSPVQSQAPALQSRGGREGRSLRKASPEPAEVGSGAWRKEAGSRRRVRGEAAAPLEKLSGGEAERVLQDRARLAGEGGRAQQPTCGADAPAFHPEKVPSRARTARQASSVRLQSSGGQAEPPVSGEQLATKGKPMLIYRPDKILLNLLCPCSINGTTKPR